MSRTEWTGGAISRVNAQDVDFYIFQFAPNGTSAPAGVTSRKDGMVASVTYSATGLFIVQLVDTLPGTLIGATCSVCSTTAGAMRGFSAEPDGTNTVLTSGQIGIALYNGTGSLTNVTAGTGEFVTVVLWFSKNPNVTA